MHKILTLTLPAVAICLSSCVNEPSRYKNSGEVASIWQRSPQYSVAPPARRYTEANQATNRAPSRPSSTAAYNTYTGINRYGSVPTPPRNSYQYPYSPPRLSAVAPRSNNQQPSASSEPADRQPPQERRLSPDLDNMPPAGGYETREAVGSNAENLASTKRNETPAQSGSFSHLPMAVPVPGKSGYVSLPAPYTNSPEIDVRGIPPGTPVEIPDSNNPGKTIQFRVP
tara:strand:+ start:3946 stop:4626 length:681 start_codon:yes stop_codon:yes gene_type:complete